MHYIQGWAQRKTLLVAVVAFALGSIVIIWTLVGSLSDRPATRVAPQQAFEPETAFADLPELEQEEELPQATTLPAEKAVIVYISGAVLAPDVYRLPAEARVKDVVVAAGGFAANADPNAINLAARLSDEQHIYVPRQGEAQAAPVANAGSAAPAAPEADGQELININTASPADLDELPGIGQSIATRIVDYRTANGPFGSIDDLKNVKGIGASLFEQIAPLVTVGA